MQRPKKTIQIYYEDWQKLKKQAVDQEISIADLIEELWKTKQ